MQALWLENNQISLRDVPRPNKQNEVLIKVKSNLGRSYQVTQNVLSDLASSTGEKIPAKYFSVQTLSENNTKGNLKVASKIPVEKGNLL